MPRRANNPISVTIPLILLMVQTHLRICNGVSVLELNSLELGGKRLCSSSGNIEECFNGGFEMDSEINRRVLTMQKRYISYETLRRDMIPCGRAGAPYYNCHVGPANPYSRGCEVITGCRGTIKDINN